MKSLEVLNTLENLPEAQFPRIYDEARTKIAECQKVDEVKQISDQAMALAMYAKQVNDEELLNMVKRIHGRAVRQAGIIFNSIESKAGQPKKNGVGTDTINKTRAAKAAGMSERQRHTAQRVAKVPEDSFESQIESDSPPTVTQLAQEGKQVSVVDEFARDHTHKPDKKWFSKSIYLRSGITRLLEQCREYAYDDIASGTLESDFAPTIEEINELIHELGEIKSCFKMKLKQIASDAGRLI